MTSSASEVITGSSTDNEIISLMKISTETCKEKLKVPKVTEIIYRLLYYR